MSTAVINSELDTAITGEEEFLCRVAGLTIHPLETSCKDPQYVVRLPGGKLIRISKKVREVLDELELPITHGQLASNLACRWNHVVTPDDVRQIISRLLKPSHLLAGDDTSNKPPARTSGSFWWRKFLLQDFFFSFKLIPSSVVTKVARRTAPIINKFLVPVVVALLILASISAYRDFAALRDSGQFKITDPAQYMLVLIYVFLSIVFHEIGHASAVAKFGGVPDDIGFGLYFIYPALYANVNQSWYF